jgi:putative transposase
MKQGHWTSARTCVFNIGYQIVWSTKYRRKALIGPVEIACKNLFQEIAESNDFTISSLEIMPDHIHVFVSAHPKYAPGHIVKALKGVSGKALLKMFPELHKTFRGGHIWNPSTYYGTVGDVSRETVQRYIEMQKSNDGE